MHVLECILKENPKGEAKNRRKERAASGIAGHSGADKISGCRMQTTSDYALDISERVAVCTLLGTVAMGGFAVDVHERAWSGDDGLREAATRGGLRDFYAGKFGGKVQDRGEISPAE